MDVDRRSRLIDLQETQVLVAGFAFVSAVGAWMAGVSPTGLAFWDNIVVAAFAAMVVFATSAAKRWSWLPIAICATILPAPAIISVIGIAALSVAGAAFFTDGKRNRMSGAFVGAASMQALLRADERLFFGFNSILVGIVTLLVLYVGYQTASRGVRRSARFMFVGTGVFIVIAVLGVVGAIALGRSAAERGVDAARSGLDAARLGEQEVSVEQLAAAEASFEDAAATFSAFYTMPARLVPVLGQHMRTLAVASREGRSIVAAARSVALEADVQRLRPSGGAIDLALLTGMGQSLSAADDSLTAADLAIADSNSRWLLPPVRGTVNDLRAELASARTETSLARNATEMVPVMLGADRPFRYFVMFATPAESRELGGFLGAYAVLEASQGTFSLVEVGNNTALTDSSIRGVIEVPANYPPWYSEYRLNKFPMNLPGTPDLLTVLAATNDLMPSVAGAPIDAIVYMDPFATEAFVDLVGELSIEGLDMALTGKNTADFLLEGQYAQYPDPIERKAFLVDMLSQTFGQLLAADLPGPETLGAKLGPSARQGRLQVATFNPDVNSFLRRVYLLRDFPRPDGLDFFSIVQASGSPTKLDTYLSRQVDYSVRVQDIATGRMEATATIDLSYDPPANPPDYVIAGGVDEPDWQGLALDGSTRTLLSIYTPHELAELRVNGVVTAASIQLEYGYWRHLTSVDLAPGEQVIIEFDLLGEINLSAGYWLTMANQPLVNDDNVTITVEPPPDWNIGVGQSGEAVQTSFVLTEDQRLGWQFSRS